MKISEKSKYLKKAGDLSSLYGIRDITYNSGKAKGVHAYEVKNGNQLNLSVFADRGLDIPMLEFRGKNIGFLSKSGISSPFSYCYTHDGTDSFLRQFAGGFLTTCGITFSGAACVDDGETLPLHGRISNTVAENVYVCQEEEDDEVVLKLCGDIREARLFGENMVLHREILVYTESNRVKIHDIVENQGFQKQPVLMIYHVNFGYPMLDTGARMYFSSEEVEPQTEFARKGMPLYDIVEEPEDIREEQCYYHTGQKNPENSFVMLHNEKLEMAAIIKYDARQCPVLCEWKSMQSGDYALGLEPTTSGTKGRAEVRKAGELREIDGQETCEFHLEFLFLDRSEDIKYWSSLCKESRTLPGGF
jgi:hypothetical protein